MADMEEIVKNLVYTGVGLVAFTAEKVKESIDRLVEEDKISAEEGRKIVDEFIQNTESKKEALEQQLKLVVEDVMKNFSGGGKSEKMEDLEARIAALEAKSTKK